MSRPKVRSPINQEPSFERSTEESKDVANGNWLQMSFGSNDSLWVEPDELESNGTPPRRQDCEPQSAQSRDIKQTG